MSFLHHLISEATIYALGWTVLHSCGQAMAIGLGLALISLGIQRRSPRIRYLAGNLALVLVLVVSIITFIDLYRPVGSAATAATYFVVAGGAEAPAAVEVPFLEQYLAQLRTYFNRHLPLIVSLWMLGAGVFALRLLGGLAYLQRLRNRGAFPVAGQWRRRLDALAHLLDIRVPVRLLESTQVQAPMVIGHLKPVILLPVGAVNGLTPAQVEAVLAHELAHIARRDYLFNIFQSLVEALFYFNPAVWWISAYIRVEREHCCDDVAVTIGSDPLSYARALLTLQERSQAAPALAMAFLGKRRRLLDRVRRLLQPSLRRPLPRGRLFAAAALLLGLGLLSMLEAPTESAIVTPLPGRPLTVQSNSALPPALPVPPAAPADTLPQEPTSLEVVKGNGERLKVQIDRGEITALEIDGRPVPEAEYQRYEPIVEQYLTESALPEPPLPPSPPRPPRPEIAPPPPPPGWDDSIERIERSIDEDGRRRIIIERKNGAVLQVDPEGAEPFLFLEDIAPDSIFSGLFEFRGDDLVFSAAQDAMERLELQLEGLEDSLWGLQEQHRFRLRTLRDTLELHFEQLPREQLEALHQQLSEMDLWQERLEEQLRDRYRWMEEIPGVNTRTRFSVTGGSAYLDDEIRAQLEAELLRDGLIDDPRHYELELSKGNLTVNGQRQPSPTARKYWEFYEEVSGIELSEETAFHIRREAN